MANMKDRAGQALDNVISAEHGTGYEVEKQRMSLYPSSSTV